MTGMKSLLARASSGSKKDPQAAEAAATHPNTGNGSSHGSGSGGKGMIPDDARSPPSKRAATQAAVEEGGKGKLYATTTHEEVPPRAVPSVRCGWGGVGRWACVGDGWSDGAYIYLC